MSNDPVARLRDISEREGPVSRHEWAQISYLAADQAGLSRETSDKLAAMLGICPACLSERCDCSACGKPCSACRCSQEGA